MATAIGGRVRRIPTIPITHLMLTSTPTTSIRTTTTTATTASRFATLDNMVDMTHPLSFFLPPCYTKKDTQRGCILLHL